MNPDTSVETVDPRFACPNCGESDCDELEWVSESEVVCNTCGTLYEP